MQNTTVNLYNGNIHQDTLDTIKNPTIATASNCVAITQITVTTASLTTNLTSMNKKFSVILHAKRAIHRSHGRHDRASRGRGARDRSPIPAGTAGVLCLDPGYRQISAKFPKPVAMNIYNATKMDMQGGAKTPQ